MDSGASKTVLSRGFFHKFRPGVALKISEVKLESVTGQPVAIDGEIQLTIDGIGKQSFLVLDGIKGDGIIGSDFLKNQGATIDFAKFRLRVGQKHVPMFKQCSADECPLIGGYPMWVPELEMPVWLDDLRGHAVFRDELGMCVVGDPIDIVTTAGPIKPGSLGYLPRCSAHRATPARPQGGG